MSISIKSSINTLMLDSIRYIKKNLPMMAVTNRKRFNIMEQYIESQNIANVQLTLQQALVVSNLLGEYASLGFPKVKKPLQFPEADAIQFGFQAGWHGFMGTYVTKEGNEIGMMYNVTTYTLVSKDVADRNKWTDLDNTLVSIQGNVIDKNAKKFYHVEPNVYQGSASNITIQSNPFYIKITDPKKENVILTEYKSLQPDNLYPMQTTFAIPEFGIDMSLLMRDPQGRFLQGDEGCFPCTFGMGTLYYSHPNLRASGTIKMPQKTYLIDSSNEIHFWMDHEWGNFYKNFDNFFARIILNVVEYKKPINLNWLWFGFQFDDGVSLAVASFHPVGKIEYSTHDPRAQKVTPDNKKTFTEVNIEVSKTETSETDVLYPVEWIITFEEKKYTVKSLIPDRAFVNPWINAGEASEARVDIFDEHGDKVGVGSAESMGYFSIDQYTRNQVNILMPEYQFSDVQRNLLFNRIKETIKVKFIDIFPSVLLSFLFFLILIIIIVWIIKYTTKGLKKIRDYINQSRSSPANTFV